MNFLLILQLLAISLSRECKRVYLCGLSLKNESIYALVSYMGKQRSVEINRFVQTLASLEIHVEFSKASLFRSILLLLVSTQVRLTLIHLNLIFCYKRLSSEEINGMSG